MPKSKAIILLHTIILGLVALGASTPSVLASGDDDGDAELHGTIEQLPASGLIGDWRVSGRTVHVSSSTEIKQEHGQAAVGARVEVKGDGQSDGSIDARKIEVESSASGGGSGDDSGGGSGDDSGGGSDDGPGHDSGDDNGHDANEIHGTIEQLPASGLIGDWLVSGRTVHVSASTLVKQEHGQAVVGASVEVKGSPQSDGSIAATTIEVNSSNSGGSTGGEAKFFGTVESLPQSGLVGMWSVSGRTVRVTETTTVSREHGVAPGIGSYVKVEGAQQADGSIVARELEVKTAGSPATSNSSAGYIELKARVDVLPASGLVGEWMVGGRTVLVSSATAIKQKRSGVQIGSLVEVRGNMREDGAVDANRVEMKSSKGRGGASKFYGTIESMPSNGFAGTWTIAGRSVEVSASTVVEQNLGQAAVGAYVEVKGSLRADGTLAASKIEVKSGSGNPTGSSGYIEFKGTIESLPQSGRTGEWRVSGRRVFVSSGTRIRERDGQIRIGARVEVEGNQRTDGSVDAAKVDVKN